MNNITIFDNFLNDTELDILHKYISEKSYNYGHTSGDMYEKITNIFFSSYNDEDFFNEYMLHKIENISNKKFTLLRHYMHIQTFGLDGAYHIDDSRENTWTFCIYYTHLKNDEFEINNAGGEFYIKIPNEPGIITIEPYMNRGIFFPSGYVHKGVAYNKLFNNMRLCLTWKLKEII
jgi:hypothetical protein